MVRREDSEVDDWERVYGLRGPALGPLGPQSKEPVDRPLLNRLAFIYGGAGGGVTAPLFVMLKIRTAAEVTVKER